MNDLIEQIKKNTNDVKELNLKIIAENKRYELILNIVFGFFSFLLFLTCINIPQLKMIHDFGGLIFFVWLMFAFLQLAKICRARGNEY